MYAYIIFENVEKYDVVMLKCAKI